MILVFIFTFAFFCVVLEHTLPRNKYEKCVYFCYLFILIIFSNRGDTVPDTLSYKSIYYGENEYVIQTIEPAYLLVNRLGLLIGLDFHSFLFIILLFMILMWHYVTKKVLKDIPLALLLFISFIGIFYWGVVLRNAIGLSICYAAVVSFQNTSNSRRYLYFVFFILLASLFHYSMLSFFLIPLFAQRSYSNSILYLYCMILLFIPFLDLQSLLSDNIANVLEDMENANRFHGYMRDENYSTNVYPVRYLKNICFALWFITMRNYIICNKYRYDYFLNIYMIGCGLAMGLHFIGGGGSRFALNFLFFEFIILGLVYQDSFFDKRKTLFAVCMCAIINFVLMIIIYSFFYD